MLGCREAISFIFQLYSRLILVDEMPRYLGYLCFPPLFSFYNYLNDLLRFMIKIKIELEFLVFCFFEKKLILFYFLFSLLRYCVHKPLGFQLSLCLLLELM